MHYYLNNCITELFATELIVFSYFHASLCFQTGALLSAFVQLCHISTPLAEKTWIQLFSRLWKILSDRQQHVRPSLALPLTDSSL